MPWMMTFISRASGRIGARLGEPRRYTAAPTAAATSSATREWFTKNAAFAPEAAASSALWMALPASPATYTPATLVSRVVGSALTPAGAWPIGPISQPSILASSEPWRWGGT
jgi:hypothetical protein